MLGQFELMLNGNCDQELGIFDALEKRYLAGAQLTIFEDKIDPSNVYEAYTFSFKYSGSSNCQGLGLAGMRLEHRGGKSATVREVKYGVEMLVRRLVLLSTVLPELPGNVLFNVLFSL